MATNFCVFVDCEVGLLIRLDGDDDVVGVETNFCVHCKVGLLMQLDGVDGAFFAYTLSSLHRRQPFVYPDSRLVLPPSSYPFSFFDCRRRFGG